MSDCIEPTKLLGGKSGTELKVDRIFQKHLVNKIEYWRGANVIYGIRLSFTDNHSRVIGKIQGQTAGSISFDFAGGELITSLSIWLNESGSKIAGFQIKTNAGQEFFPQILLMNMNAKRHNLPVGSGVMLGAYGKYFNDVHALCFLMMREIKSVTLKEVVYGQNIKNAKTKRHVSVLDVIVENKTTLAPIPFSKRVNRIAVACGEWCITRAPIFCEDFKVIASVQKLNEYGSSWIKSAMETHETKSWKDVLDNDTYVIEEAKPLEKVNITVKYFEGKISKLLFKAILCYELKNGATFKLPIDGTYDGISNTVMVRDCKVIAKWNGATQSWNQA